MSDNYAAANRIAMALEKVADSGKSIRTAILFASVLIAASVVVTAGRGPVATAVGALVFGHAPLIMGFMGMYLVRPLFDIESIGAFLDKRPWAIVVLMFIPFVLGAMFQYFTYQQYPDFVGNALRVLFST